jgi:hypothetical protein
VKLPNLLVSRAKDKNLTGGPRSNGFVGISGRDLFLKETDKGANLRLPGCDQRSTALFSDVLVFV